MDGSSLPEPPQREETGTLTDLLSRAVANSRIANANLPAGGNPFARFAADSSKPDGAGAAGFTSAPSVYKQQLQAAPVLGLAPATGPFSAAGVCPPTVSTGVVAGGGQSILPSHHEDEMEEPEPLAKRRKKAGRVLDDDEEDDDAHQTANVGYAPLGGSGVVSAGVHGGPGEPSPLPLEPSPYDAQLNAQPNQQLNHQLNRQYNPQQLNPQQLNPQMAHQQLSHQQYNQQLTHQLNHPQLQHQINPQYNTQLNHQAQLQHPQLSHHQLSAPQYNNAQALPSAAPVMLPPAGMVSYSDTSGLAAAGHGYVVNDPQAHLRRPPTRLGGLQPPRPGLVVHAGAATPGGAFRSIGSGTHHPHPLPTALPHGASPAMIAAYAAALQNGMGMPGGVHPGGYMMPQMSGFPGRPGGMANGNNADDDEEDGDRAEEVLQQVERISRSLRGALGEVSLQQQRLAAGLDGGASGAGAGMAAAGPSSGDSRPLVNAADIANVTGSAEVAARLKPYQLVGINYLLQLAAAQVGGAILADEMGLGKTAQTCVYLSCLKPLLADPGPHLVVVPASLLENWQRELRAWAPGLKVVTYYGPNREQVRHRIKRNWDRIQRGKEPLPDDEIDEEGAQLPAGGEGGEDDDGAQDETENGGSEAADAEEEEEDEDGEDYGQPRMVQRQPGKGGGCGGLFDVFLTTYTLWERDGGHYSVDRAFMMKWPWSHLVMDEAHALKNSASSRSRKLRKIAKSAGTRIMLTGTPLQNDLLELHALLAFLLPHIFTAGEGADALAAQVAEAAKPVAGPGGGGLAKAAAQDRLVERMKQLLQPFILRRLKSEVADQLVNKKHHLVMLDMLPEQKDLYAATIASMRDEVSKEVSASAATGAGRGRGRGRGRPRKGTAATATAEAAAASPQAVGPLDVSRLSSSRVQHIFTQLRKVAQHPLLIRAKYSQKQLTTLAEMAADYSLFGGGPSVERCLQELSTYSDHQIHCFAQAHPKLLASYILPTDAVLCSAKLKYLDDLLPQLKEKGSRVLLFSQWTTVLDLLEWYLHLRGHVYCRLDGSTQVEDRLAMVDKFNAPESPFFVFLLSTRAGGQGLNLTGADTVILHDVDFNPQTDKQAEDRAHRLGQQRPVTVYRLVTKDTVDATIQAIAERKLALDQAVLGDVTVGEGGASGGGGGRGRGRGRGGVSAAEVKHMAEILSSLLAGPGEGGQGSAQGQGQPGQQQSAAPGTSAPGSMQQMAGAGGMMQQVPMAGLQAGALQMHMQQHQQHQQQVHQQHQQQVHQQHQQQGIAPQGMQMAMGGMHGGMQGGMPGHLM